MFTERQERTPHLQAWWNVRTPEHPNSRSCGV